ncbi:hypothetical protein KSF_074200 [Reticulibacter mediterranei]|uniref:Uncharacterized protein n=1 Tax=Reticulibacter mediterranei TaxID=2778369 RepID=A0A8J3N3S7_9CHLR|nr:hypothetical protein [Reticulibacter mediterranei]GHO97372.1 hypothetical protein KSF_074200 [Reticulibacter mediterranei]
MRSFVNWIWSDLSGEQRRFSRPPVRKMKRLPSVGEPRREVVSTAILTLMTNYRRIKRMCS